MGTAIVETSIIAFLHSLMYGGELFQFLPDLQPVRVLSAPRANFKPCAAVMSYLATTQTMAFGVHHSHEQNAKHGAAPGLQTCLSVLLHRSKDALGFALFVVSSFDGPETSLHFLGCSMEICFIPVIQCFS